MAIKFNHDASSIVEAVGAGTPTVESVEVALGDEEELSDEAKAHVIMLTLMRDRKSYAWKDALSDLTGIKFCTGSRLVEYLLKHLSRETYRTLALRIVIESAESSIQEDGFLSAFVV